ncbi:hypothetical protein LWI29_007441 [Acer saccharum]|uniref:Factor of DNA methylation 1-5/IDN2 domain-containing protein n=1 Tax=Acer saccharum TaxID=4024 RepID=A0AA39TA93_ACESA|nr:hypothetical protein LWI29_007441 [Acer saccharum]
MVVALMVLEMVGGEDGGGGLPMHTKNQPVNSIRKRPRLVDNVSNEHSHDANQTPTYAPTQSDRGRNEQFTTLVNDSIRDLNTQLTTQIKSYLDELKEIDRRRDEQFTTLVNDSRDLNAQLTTQIKSYLDELREIDRRRDEQFTALVNAISALSNGPPPPCVDRSKCTKTKYYTSKTSTKPLVLKELRKCWDDEVVKGKYNEFNTLLLDDSPYKALLNPAHTGVFPTTYDGKEWDDELGRKTAVLNRKMIELETKIEAKKTLELEIESMKSDIEVMKQKDIVDDRDMDLIKKKMEALERDVKEKEEKLEEMEKLFGALTAVKERKANDELQDFRQVIINLLKESKPAIIGVKMMGQIDIEAIRTAVEARKLPANTTELLYAKWKRYLVDPKLSRFKIIMDKEGNCKKFSGEIKKNLEKCLLAMDAFEKKSEEREKQLQLRVEELEKQLQLHEEVQFDSEKERLIKPDRMVMNGFVLLPENNILTNPAQIEWKTIDQLEMKFETSEKKMDVVMNDLKKKEEKMQEMEELIKALTVKHCKLDEELQDARKVISIMMENNDMKEDIRKMRRNTYDDITKIFSENDQVKLQLVQKEKELKKREKKLKLQEARIEAERIELRTQKRMRLGEKKTRDIFGVKIMGELDRKPFLEAMKRKFQGEEAEEESIMLWSCLRKCIKDPTWHPFKILVDMEGNCKV